MSPEACAKPNDNNMFIKIRGKKYVLQGISNFKVEKTYLYFSKLVKPQSHYDVSLLQYLGYFMNTTLQKIVKHGSFSQARYRKNKITLFEKLQF